MAARVKQAGVQSDLATLGLSSLLPILGFQMADYASCPSHVDWLGAVHSDFFPVLEYVAPRGFFIGTEAKGVKLLDRRSLSPRNAGLWVQEYLNTRPVTAGDLRECFVFTSARPGLFDRASAAWAREWMRRFPDDPAAQTAGLELSPQTYAGSMGRGRLKESRKDKFWGLVSGKALCRFGYEDYIASRDYLETGGARVVLASIQDVMGRYPEEKDPQLLRWRGQLEYDLGLYSESAANLVASVQWLQSRNGKRDDVIDAGLVLCESLLAMGERARAMSVCEGPLAPFGDELSVVLMKSRIRDGL
jgi:hypothetical protein